MEYVFRTKGNVEILKTKGSAHSNLEGFHELEQKYPDQMVTDRFRIVKKLDSKEDEEKNCYDWYEIDNHYRFTDKFASNIRSTELEITDHDLSILEAEQFLTDLDLRVMALENNE